MTFLLFFALFIQTPAATCGDAAECRGQAVEAAAAGDYERSHDLAWRAVQKGRPNDPELMLVLARAQALSGRPGDALVMLGRIADLGGKPDVANDPDFRRVRALSGWTELEAKLAGRPAEAPPASGSAPSASAASPTPAPRAAASPAAAPSPSAPHEADSLSFSAPDIDAFGLARDAVSRRFVIGDRRAHRLLVIDEVSRNVVNFVSAATAGFYEELTAFTIDSRRGDLWVTSAHGEGDARSSIVHKLQLVSGRALMEVRPPERSGPIRLVGISVAPDGTVYALDAVGARVFRAKPGALTLESVMRLDAEGVSTLAAADDRTLYVATAKGLLRVDLGGRAATAVASAEPLGGFESLSWRAGALVGVERVGDGSRVVRVGLDPAGGRAISRKVLATSPASTVGAVAGDSFYYLSDEGTIRRLSLR